MPVPGQITYFEPDGAGTRIQDLPLIGGANVPVQRQSPTVVAEFADEKVVSAIPSEVELLDEDGPEERVDEDSPEL